MSAPDDFYSLFVPEDRAVIPTVSQQNLDASVWKVLLVDDEPDVHAVLRLALSDIRVLDRKLEILDAHGGDEARGLLQTHPDIALILLDVVMETEQAGLDLVRHVRTQLGRSTVQIILVTGQPGYAPQRDVIQAYEIDGYRLKSELTNDKIFVAVYAALRTHQIMLDKESALEDAQRFRKAMDRAPCRIYLKDKDKKYVYGNRPTLDFLGRELAQLAGSSDEAYFSGPQLEHLRRLDERVLTGVESQEEIEVGNWDGQRRVFWEVKTPVWDDENQVWGICGVATDITERKYLEEELDQHRRHLERLVAERTLALEDANISLRRTLLALDRVGMGVFWINLPDGSFSYANDEACRQLDLDRGQLLRLSHADISPEFSLERIQQLYRDMAVSGQPHRSETRYRRRDGNCYPVDVTLYLQSGDDGDWFIAFFSDISERKLFEAELIQARNAAEAANRAKSTFLANMSHELRTPMNAIMGMTGLALRHAHDPKLRTQLEKVEQASHHLLSVINDILDISKIEADKLVLAQEEFRLGTLHENLLSLLGQKAAAKNLCFSIETPPELARQAVLGDSLHLMQILVNLTANAVKFTDQGQVAVSARIVEEQGDSLLLRHEVRDTGVGIEPHALPRLFSAFEQADHSLTRRYGGTGLGLAISKRLVALMGGSIGVDSQPGVGSTFWFTVRLGKVGHPAEGTDDARPQGAEGELQRDFGGTAVLLVEDEPINREISSELLQDVGLQVDMAENGRQAVDMAALRPYRLILMDMQMPELNGLDATRAIRRLPEYRQVPILAMTANAFNEDRQACLEAGMDDHVPKPIDPDQLFETLLKWLRVSAKTAREVPE